MLSILQGEHERLSVLICGTCGIVDVGELHPVDKEDATADAVVAACVILIAFVVEDEAPAFHLFRLGEVFHRVLGH
jgi:hypothetical protein